MKRWLAWRAALVSTMTSVAISLADGNLSVGFGKADITPVITKDRPVWIAGYGAGRAATGVHDPLWSRAVVISDGTTKMAFVSVDVVGLQYPLVKSVRAKLQQSASAPNAKPDDGRSASSTTDQAKLHPKPKFAHIMISSTHNHEGPDVIGLWGKTNISSGVDPKYLAQIEAGIIASVNEAEQNLRPARALFGVAHDTEQLIKDSRQPRVIDDQMRLIDFRDPQTNKRIGVFMQWNCHPESMESRNTLITSDFIHYTREYVEKKYQCPCFYVTGTVGGLLSHNTRVLKDGAGNLLKGGTWEFCEAFGHGVGRIADHAIAQAKPIALLPAKAHVRRVALPIENRVYLALRFTGVLNRDAYEIKPSRYEFGPMLKPGDIAKPSALETEVGYLQLGDLAIASIPGEIYPELVHGIFQEPVDPAADFPTAPLEPNVMALLPGKHKMIFGLANDEVGYIIPKRQWDNVAPYCYQRKESQYGEINSCGPNSAPILMQALADCIADAKENRD